MRLILAAAALTALALPASAQRLDTRRVDIKTVGDRTTCGFNAYPGMTLVENKDLRTVILGLPAEGAQPDIGPTMSLLFGQAQDWRRPAVMGILLGGRGSATLKADAIFSGRLRVDGGPAFALFATNGDGNGETFTMISDMAINPAIYAMIDHSQRVDVDLLDARGKVLRSFNWDTRRVSDAVETVSVVGWSCTSP